MAKGSKGLGVKKNDNLSEWYAELVLKAELADYAPVKGFMIIRPNAYSIWEKIQDHFNSVLKRRGVKNVYFPLLVPDSFFKREAEHAKGFSPELAYIKNTEDGELLALRPTSETVMYDSYSKWIRSWRDLPLQLNQWCNVVRWEVKQTKPFLRTREFLWQEGHCAFVSEKVAEENMMDITEEYRKLVEDVLAIPVIVGKKSKAETFAGAKKTMTLEALMPDGKALQMGTSHNLGQGFSKSFDVKYKGSFCVANFLGIFNKIDWRCCDGSWR
jgi:prolyl-tRNA synthetase